MKGEWYPWRIPVVVNVRDRLTDLLELLGWLDHNGYERILLLDNASTYPPLVEWLETCPYRVMRLKENLGSRAPWLADVPERGEWWVYTDCDVVPTERCPDDAVAHLHHLLLAHPEVPKAGLGLYTRDLVRGSFHDWYRETTFQNAAERWLGDCFLAPVETTFALYRPGEPFSYEAVRSAHPYEARHLPWYREKSPTEEDIYYLSRARVAGLDAQGQATGGSDWAGFWKVSAGSDSLPL